MTNDQTRTDLEVAKDLKKLTEVIDNSLHRADAILKQAKEVEEIRIVISEVRTSRDQLIESQREAREIGDQLSQRLEYLQTLETNIRQLDAQVSRNLEAVESCGNLIDELTQAKRELEEINVTSLVEQARLILEDVNNIRAESQKIQQENQAIYAAIDRYNENIDNANSILTQLESIKSKIEGIEGLDEIRNLLQQVDNTRVELTNSKHQLSLLQGEIREIQYLENYLQDFGRVRNHKQLRQFLRQELGFIGLIVYVLHLLTRNRKR
ncbi:hypothetical protein [Umezakia ovalisporum]|jgi:DNA repair exonuclease SbcCD ATPase subunit|uniref:hypothetical protein n=1 Tax=Umezakia ovalisporum TaxID=75695 RepID=UPI0026BDCAFF